jgi:hypothetical protein
MHISPPELNRHGSDVQFQVQVESGSGRQPLWYRVDSSFDDLLSDRSDAALVALLIPAMIRGEDIHVAGTISEKTFYNASNALQEVLRLVMPFLHRIKVAADDIRPSPAPALGVATGFSGGIDAFCTLAGHHYRRDIAPGYRLTHLLFNSVGSVRVASDDLFRERCQQLKRAVDRLGLPFVTVRSNLDTFYPTGSFQQTHTLRNASVALLLQNGLGRFLYASSHPYVDTFVGEADAPGFSEPVLLPLLSNGALDAISVDCEYTRVQKTVIVADIPDSYDTLDVCFREENGVNCSACRKCLRTLLTLEIAGRLDRYAAVFDAAEYHRQRGSFIERVKQSVTAGINNNDAHLREIAAFADHRGFTFPRTVTGGLRHARDLVARLGNIFRAREASSTSRAHR